MTEQERAKIDLVLSTSFFEPDRLVRAVPTIREGGFGRLEVVDRPLFEDRPGVITDLARASRDVGVEIPNWHLVMVSPFQQTPAESRLAIDRVKRSMDRGYCLGARNHVVHWYQRFRDPRRNDLWRAVVDEWVASAAAMKVRLLMETPPDKPGNERYVPSTEVGDFVRDYPAEVLSFCIDVNHSNLKENLADVVHVLKDRLVTLHVSDNDGKSEKHWLPGQGVIDFPSLFQALTAIDFCGMAVLEVDPWCAQAETLPELKKLHDFCRWLLKNKTPHPATPAPARGP